LTSPAAAARSKGLPEDVSVAEVSAGSSSSASSIAANAYAGLWYAAFTPNAAGATAGLGTAGTVSGGAVLVAAADGNVYGMTDGGYFFSGGRFVTSTTAPMATGWSDSCRVGLAPTERSRLFTAHITPA